MKIEINKKYLITTTNWFYAPDGNSYRAVYGTVTGVHADEEILGIKTNRHSANWYVVVGNMIVAGCQIYYCIQTNNVSNKPPTREIDYEGVVFAPSASLSRIYFSDEVEI